jgi:hypothetical protein
MIAAVSLRLLYLIFGQLLKLADTSPPRTVVQGHRASRPTPRGRRTPQNQPQAPPRLGRPSTARCTHPTPTRGVARASPDHPGHRSYAGTAAWSPRSGPTRAAPGAHPDPTIVALGRSGGYRGKPPEPPSISPCSASRFPRLTIAVGAQSGAPALRRHARQQGQDHPRSQASAWACSTVVVIMTPLRQPGS